MNGRRARETLTGALVLVAALALALGDGRASQAATGELAPGEQSFPKIASDGTNYLVAWRDDRTTSGWDIVGTRVNRDGVVLDPDGVLISDAPARQMSPDVAFDGSNYLVTWDDERRGDFDVYSARVTPSGSVLDPDGIPITTAPNHQGGPAVEFDGTNYMIVWNDWRAGFDIYGARMSPTGTVLDPGGIQISPATAMQEGPALAFDGTNYLVAWQDDRSSMHVPDIYGARVTRAGAVLDPAGIAISTAYGYQRTPAVAFGGSNYFVAWADRRSTRDEIYASRVTPAGLVLDPDGIAVAARGSDRLAIQFDGSNYLVVWSGAPFGQSSDIYAARVSQSGEILDPGGILVSGAWNEQMHPDVTFNGTTYFVAWTDYRACLEACGEPDVYGARVTTDGSVLDPDGILLTTNSPSPPPFPPPPPGPPPPPPSGVRCVVPQVIGLRMTRARARIRRANCSVGRIRRAKARRIERVIGQSPRPGGIRRRGFPVKLVVARR